METLPEQFKSAISNVTISGTKEKRAIAAHQEVGSVLLADPELRDWGIDPFLIGSYGRKTARYPGKDVDMFLRFVNLSVRHRPAPIYEGIARVLVARYGSTEDGPDGRVTPQGRSLKVDFPEPDDKDSDLSFSVDAVPAVPWDANWGIPNRDIDQWDNADSRWIKTNPIGFNSLTDTLATAAWSPVVDDRNAYRPIVRLLRQVRHVHLGEQRPGGLSVEVVAYHAWNTHKITGNTWAQLLANSLEGVSEQLQIAAGEGLLDPVLSTPMTPNLNPAEWSSAASTFSGFARQAREALDSDKCRAAKTWREILGTNDRGQVLPLPAGCDANGFPISGIAAVAAVGSNEPRGFA